jgi:hypothetical protein
MRSIPIRSKQPSATASPPVAPAGVVVIDHTSALETDKATTPMSAKDGATGNAKDFVSNEEKAWKWPLTHAERILELERFVMTAHVDQRENIEAAIEYHRGFPASGLCSPVPVYFINGERVELNELKEWNAGTWFEVKGLDYDGNILTCHQKGSCVFGVSVVLKLN